VLAEVSLWKGQRGLKYSLKASFTCPIWPCDFTLRFFNTKSYIASDGSSEFTIVILELDYIKDQGGLTVNKTVAQNLTCKCTFRFIRLVCIGKVSGRKHQQWRWQGILKGEVSLYV